MLTSGQISQLTGISDRTIRDWQTKGKIPESADMGAIVRAIIAHLKSQVEEARKPQGGNTLEAAKIRVESARAAKLELEVAEKEGTLVCAKEVVLTWAKYIQACKTRLFAIPSELAEILAEVDDKEKIRGILQGAIDEAAIELGSEEFATGAGSADSNGDGVSATSEADD